MKRENKIWMWLIMWTLACFVAVFASCKPSQNAISGTNNWKPGKVSEGHAYNKHQQHYRACGSLNQ